MTLNLYGYLGNNPLRGIDPDGHSSETEEAEARYEGFVRQATMGARSHNHKRSAQQQSSPNSSASSDKIATALSNVPGVASVTPAPDSKLDVAKGGHQNETDALTFKTPEDLAKFNAESSRKPLVLGDVSENGSGQVYDSPVGFTRSMAAK